MFKGDNMDGIILMERNIIFVRSQEYILRDFIEHKVKHITMKMINRIPEKNRQMGIGIALIKER